MAAFLHRAPNAHRGFTLVELMVVIVILSILSGLALAGLARAAKKGKAETTKFLIGRLSDAILEYYEQYEDLSLTLQAASPYSTPLQTLRARMREELPDSWDDVAPSTNFSSVVTATGRAYQRYKAAHPGVTANNSFQGAECLYMIVTESGLFPDLIETVKPERVGDVDGDGAREFLDGWNRPIEFMRWAPGLPQSLTTIQVPDKDAAPDPCDVYGVDPGAYALFPLLYSSGPDGAAGESGAYGLVVAENGWPSANLNNICDFRPNSAKLVGEASDPASSASKDNITNHRLLAE